MVSGAASDGEYGRDRVPLTPVELISSYPLYG
jgi:hypothetical protein